MRRRTEDIVAARHLDTDRSGQAASPRVDESWHRRHLGCEILSLLPLLRALGRVRTSTPAEGDALAKATVVRALAEMRDLTPIPDLRPWLLGVQRAILGCDRMVGDGPSTGGQARGANATWERLHEALRRLPDRLREAVFLSDGAGFSMAELALVFGCNESDAGRLRRHGRTALLRQLEPATSLSVLPAYGACARRPAGTRRAMPRRVMPSSPSPSVAEAADDNLDFARRLNIVLYRTLLRVAVDTGERQGIERLIAQEATALARQRRHASERSCGAHGRGTSWLRLMFIAYSCPDPGKEIS
jgi:DNA-directed RNA polymerase specialized sigma24 family protein